MPKSLSLPLKISGYLISGKKGLIKASKPTHVLLRDRGTMLSVRNGPSQTLIRAVSLDNKWFKYILLTTIVKISLFANLNH